VANPFSRRIEGLKKRLKKSRNTLTEGISRIVRSGGSKEEILEDIEELLIGADVGAATAGDIVESVRQAGVPSDEEEIRATIAGEVARILSSVPRKEASSGGKPRVVMVVGVNGTGKTTTIAKLAHLHKSEGRKVVLAAADTFRAAAIEQLDLWAGRAGAEVVKQKLGADAASVAYDACSAARARGADVVIIDTAGRLQTKKNLMVELEKIGRVVAKVVEGAPHEVLLVLDATTGQNAVSQARAFSGACGVTGIVIAKLDGTAKGGIVVSIARQLEIPILYIGTGESMEDLEPFDPEAFAQALLS
jgi:fused signal recognition particle receptor